MKLKALSILYRIKNIIQQLLTKPTSKPLVGAGKVFKPKPKQSQTVKPISDTKRSISYGEVIEVLCSGGNYGIEGLNSNDIRQSIFLDETPIKSDTGNIVNPTGDDYLNFKGISVYERKGQPFQPVLNNFTQGLVSERLVQTEVKNNLPVSRSFINTNVTRIRIRLSFVININVKNSNGDVINVSGGSVVFRVFIRQGGGGYINRGDFTVTGKYSQPYERVWWFEVNPAVDEYQIKIERITQADTPDEKREINFISYSVSSGVLLPLKRLAYVGLKFNAEDLGTSVPERKYKLKGLILDIPSGTYIREDGSLQFGLGGWDGGFIRATPANKTCGDFFAIIWYLLTDEIDGMGDEIKPHMIDRYSLWEISKYNNELVLNYFGQTEPRFIFNLLITNQNEGWKTLESICSGCNTRFFWQNGLLTFTQDRPAPIQGIVSNADVEKGIFVYSSIDISEISTAVQVNYIDAETGKVKQEFVNDKELINRYGYKFKTIEAVGCTRRTQAIRLGRSVLISDSLEKEVVTFTCRGYAAYLNVGDVICIADTGKNKKRLGGLIESAFNDGIILDVPVEINEYEGFDDYFYLTRYPDIIHAIRNNVQTNPYQHYLEFGIAEGRRPNGYLLLVFLPNFEVQVRTIVNPPGVHKRIFLEFPFKEVPSAGSTFIILSPETNQTLYRIQSKSLDNEDLDKISLTCKQYVPYKYELIERKINIGGQRAKQKNVFPTQKPSNFSATVSSIPNRNPKQWLINLNWLASKDIAGSQDLMVSSYSISSKHETDLTFTNQTNTTTPDFSLTVSVPGKYSFIIVANRFNGEASERVVLKDFVIVS